MELRLLFFFGAAPAPIYLRWLRLLVFFSGGSSSKELKTHGPPALQITLFSRAGEPEPEPLEEKKPGAGARTGAAWKKSQEPEPLKNMPAPQPCEKIKSIWKLYFSYSSLGKISSFMVKKKHYFTCFIFFLQCYLTSLRGKEYFAKEPEPVGAGCFWPLGAGAGAARKKYKEPEPLGKKIRSRSRSRLKKKNQEPESEPEPLGKKVRSRSRLKICRLLSPARK